MSEQRKELGQHWLRDKASLQAMVEFAEVSPGDVVLEIGPGKGYLTDELVRSGASVTALEFDHTLFLRLQEIYSDTPVIRIVEGDIRKFDLSELPLDYKIVANIPYYLTANLLRKLIDDSNKPKRSALLVQKEVAERLSALPGKLSFIAVATQLFYKVGAGEVILARLFEPPPKVDSQILILSKRQKPLVAEEKIATFLQFLKAGYSQPRKKLISNLKTGLSINSSQIEEAFIKIGVSNNIRAQELSIEQWSQLTDYLS